MASRTALKTLVTTQTHVRRKRLATTTAAVYAGAVQRATPANLVAANARRLEVQETQYLRERNLLSHLPKVYTRHASLPVEQREEEPVLTPLLEPTPLSDVRVMPSDSFTSRRCSTRAALSAANAAC